MSTPSRRTPIKKSAPSTNRRAMTSQRYELRSRVSKSKRNLLVSVKRRVTSKKSSSTQRGKQPPSSEKAGVAESGLEAVRNKLFSLANAYVVGRDAVSLSALQGVLAASEVDSSSVDILLQNSEDVCTSPAMKLAETLAGSLSSENSTNGEKLDASRVLTNLAAAESFTRDDYYGDHWRPEDIGWCGVLIRSKALPALVLAVSSFARASLSQPPSPSATAICEQSCWALANLAGDSQRTRDALRSAGAISPLVSALRSAFRLAKQHYTNIQQQQPPLIPNISSTIGLCRNAAWALSNLTRGPDTSALPFLAINDPTQSLLTPSDISSFLMAPETMFGFGSDPSLQHSIEIDTTSSSNEEHHITPVTWLQVSNEACWIIAFLTAKEDAAVQFLCQDSTLCQALSYRLSQAIRDIQSNSTAWQQTQLRIGIPCIRAVGNVATACDGTHVNQLLTSSIHDSYTIPTSLARLLQIGANRIGEVSALATEAAWAAGTLLCDAGFPLPHSSTLACRTLVPALCSVVTSGTTKLDFKREALLALRNAISSPPSSEEKVTLPLRNEILNEIAKTEHFLSNLVDILILPDADAVYVGVKLIDAIFRRLDFLEYKQMFEEAGGVDALETICDRASGERNSLEESADVAADLIDDYFGEDMG